MLILVPQVARHTFVVLKPFSLKCRKVIGFALSTLRDWLKKLAPIFYPIRSKTRTRFPALASATCNYFELIGSL